MSSLTERNVFERFGFIRGQVSADSFSRGCEWFDHTGSHISYGDLGVEHFKKLAADLREGEFFIVVPGPEAYFGQVGKTLESVIAHARFMVRLGHSYEIVGKVTHKASEHGGMSFEVRSHEEALMIVKEGREVSGR